MEVVDLSISKKKEEANRTDMVGDEIRSQVVAYAKDFKTSWLNLGRHLYAIYQDKMFYAWEYQKFEDYIQKELGLNKSLALKLLKSYLFIEEDEPVYLEKEFSQDRDAYQVPGYEEVNVLRLAKRSKELGKKEYDKLRQFIFEKGKDASAVRKDLSAMIRERKQVDPDEERESRNQAAIRKMLNSLKAFKKDMESLKLVSPGILDEAQKLMTQLEREVG